MFLKMTEYMQDALNKFSKWQTDDIFVIFFSKKIRWTDWWCQDGWISHPSLNELFWDKKKKTTGFIKTDWWTDCLELK